MHCQIIFKPSSDFEFSHSVGFEIVRGLLKFCRCFLGGLNAEYK